MALLGSYNPKSRNLMIVSLASIDTLPNFNQTLQLALYQ
ncbi:hypothetical protein PMIT1327_00761 [Prochlorococcus marinus str. MIT 1327]|nr:hypothetical protein PMIT1327_00761 [Prochlorococcus marinus str. MIT 1327]